MRQALRSRASGAALGESPPFNLPDYLEARRPGVAAEAFGRRGREIPPPHVLKHGDRFSPSLIVWRENAATDAPSVVEKVYPRAGAMRAIRESEFYRQCRLPENEANIAIPRSIAITRSGDHISILIENLEERHGPNLTPARFGPDDIERIATCAGALNAGLVCARPERLRVGPVRFAKSRVARRLNASRESGRAIMRPTFAHLAAPIAALAAAAPAILALAPQDQYCVGHQDIWPPNLWTGERSGQTVIFDFDMSRMIPLGCKLAPLIAETFRLTARGVSSEPFEEAVARLVDVYGGEVARQWTVDRGSLELMAKSGALLRLALAGEFRKPTKGAEAKAALARALYDQVQAQVPELLDPI